MSIALEILELLRCPQTGQRLTVTAPEVLAVLEAQRRAGTLVLPAAQPQWNRDEPLESVLIREDGQIGYPVQGGIPILLPDHGFHLHFPPA